MSSFKITPITQGYTLGEGPHWVARDQSLLFVDIPKGNIHRFFNDSKRIQTLHLEDVGTGGIASFVVPIEGTADHFAVGVGKTLCSVKWSSNEPDNQSKTPLSLVSVDDNAGNTRFNDGKCDPAGRLWAGTTDNAFGLEINLHKGSLYKFDSKAKVSMMADKISISNGLAWSKDHNTFYYIDTMDYKVDAFDYDITSGNISNKRTVLNYKATPEIEGFPDGMTIDIDGNLWVACFGSAQVLCIDPKVGKLIRKISFPSQKTTSCCWGGPDYSTLFVTSANINMSQDEIKRLPDSGKTFAVTGLGTKGMPADDFKLEKVYWNTS